MERVTGKVVVPAIRLFEELPSHPDLTINQVVKLLKTTKPTAAKAVDVLRREAQSDVRIQEISGSLEDGSEMIFFRPTIISRIRAAFEES